LAIRPLWGGAVNLRAYRNEVWLIMHRDTDKPESKTASLRLYMDESGGADTLHAVVGGVLIYRRGFLEFEEAWDRLLAEYCIGGIHMKEFGEPDSELSKLSSCKRHDLFIEACSLIDKYRAVTIVATLSNQEYVDNVPQEVRRKFSLYGMLFNLTVVMNHKLAEFNKHDDPIPIILDAGNPHKKHVVSAHEFMLKRFQKIAGYIHLGALAFDDDKVLNILQAADIVAWGTRRRICGFPFGYGFSPINDFLTSDESHHAEIPWKAEWLREFGANIARRIQDGTAFGELTDEDLKR